MDKFFESFSNKFLAMMLVGITSIFVYALQFPILDGLTVFGVSVITAGAALMIGGLLGFFFGVPRTLQENRLLESTTSDGDENKNSSGVSYRANTNLEQISDWLTKILVGIGLTQIPTIQRETSKLITFLSPGFGNKASSPSYALSLLIYFTTCGFLTGYLWTRLSLIAEFKFADEQEVLTRVSRVEEKSEKIEQSLEKREEDNANALTLVDRQLNPRYPEVPQEHLDQALEKASSAIRIIIFRDTRKVRSENWQESENKTLMERTIPIFRALAKSDKNGKFHRTHGELGFALKDKLNPDWHEAELEFNKAIKLRGNWRKQGWTYYEFNRAICRIHQKGEGETIHRKILDDLAIAVQGGVLSQERLEEQHNSVVQKWMKEHGVSFQDLSTRQLNP